jgi:hypothetical protein
MQGHASQEIDILRTRDQQIEAAEPEECLGLDKRSLERYPLACHNLYEAITRQPMMKLAKWFSISVHQLGHAIQPDCITYSGQRPQMLQGIREKPVVVIQKVQIAAPGHSGAGIARHTALMLVRVYDLYTLGTLPIVFSQGLPRVVDNDDFEVIGRECLTENALHCTAQREPADSGDYR